METSNELQKKYGAAVMVIAIAAWIVFYFCNMRPIGSGFLLGSLASIINFVLMGVALARRLGLGLTGRKLTINIYASLGIRFLIMAGIFYLGAKNPGNFNIFAIIVGFFMIQITILAHYLKMALFPGHNN